MRAVFSASVKVARAHRTTSVNLVHHAAASRTRRLIGKHLIGKHLIGTHLIGTHRPPGGGRPIRRPVP